MELLKEVIDLAIVAILGLMGFIALWFTIERLIFLKKVKTKFAAFKNQDELDNALTNNLTTLYIIYSNAPYVGLLGTVIGIMITFYDMGQAASINASEIMTGLSLALYATALGLVVAIPTLISYNGLTRKISVISSQFKVFCESSEADFSHGTIQNHKEHHLTHGSKNYHHHDLNPVGHTDYTGTTVTKEGAIPHHAASDAAASSTAATAASAKSAGTAGTAPAKQAQMNNAGNNNRALAAPVSSKTY